MITILEKGEFREACPICGPGAHCYASGGDRRRCPRRWEWDPSSRGTFTPFPVKKSD